MPSITRCHLFPLVALLAAAGGSNTAQALSPLPTYPDLACDSEFVFADSTGDVAIFVHPNGSDDTDNIQCALNEAANLGVPVVQLISTDYSIRSLAVEQFNGTLQGTGKNTTTITVRDHSIDCSAMIDGNRAPAAIKFIGGEPRIRYLKLVANMACDDEWDLVAMVHFTGAPASETQCGNDVVFGAVDRVILDGTSSANGPRIGVSAQPEGYQLHGLIPTACNRSLLGTFRLNRSEIRHTAFGVATTMRSNAQVDVNFNTFEGQDASVWIENANQNTTVTRNRFLGHLADSNFYAGVVQTVYLESGDTPPAASRLVVNDNTFDLAPFADEEIHGVLLSGRQATDISAIVTRNRFALSSNVYAGISTSEISNGHVSANVFSGPEPDRFLVQAMILNDLGESPASGWTVSANDFSQFNVTFNPTTSGNYFGPDQAAGILDAGIGNIVIHDGNYPWIVDQKVQRASLERTTGKHGAPADHTPARPGAGRISSVVSRPD